MVADILIMLAIPAVVSAAFLAAHVIVLREPRWAVRLPSTLILNRMGRKVK
jgi:hypothetical protein